MSVTKKEIRDDIILRLTQGKPSQDFEVPSAQIDRWIDIARDRVVADYLFEVGKNDGKFVDPTYITSVNTLALSAVTDSSDELKATVSKPILSTPLNDYGLVRVRVHADSSDEYTRAQKVDTFELENIKTMEFSTPTFNNPVVYRRGQVLNFVGLKQGYSAWVTATAYAVGARVTESGNYYICLEAHTSGTFSTDLTASKWKLVTAELDVAVDFVEAMVGSSTDYSISEVHVAQVTEIAENIGRREIGLPVIADEVNDGSQNSQTENRG